MTEADRIFSRFPPFVQEFIYSHGWTELRDIQIEAAHVILDTEDNLDPKMLETGLKIALETAFLFDEQGIS